MIAWLIFWALFAASTATVWDFLAMGSLRGDRVAALTIVVLVILALLVPVLFVADLLGGIAQRTWDQSDWRRARTVIATTASVFVAVLIAYAWWVVAPVATRVEQQVRPWFTDPSWAGTIDPWSASPAAMWTILIAVTVTLIWWLVSMLRRNPFYAHARAVEALGWRKCLLGICMMAYLRTLVPRRDFFIMAPIVGWMPILALLVVIHEFIPIPLFAIAIPLLILAFAIPLWAALLAPPVWLFLGTSTVESFDLFHALRASWRRHGLTLLHRTSPGGLQSYDRWHETTGMVFYDPGIGRIWSLRTRSPMWQTAVRLTAAFVPVIVIDWRGPSPIVQWEAEWLERRALLHKTFVVVSPGSAGSSAAHGVLRGAMAIDHVTLAAGWPGAGARAPSPRS
jgi:hypothetical protein